VLCYIRNLLFWEATSLFLTFIFPPFCIEIILEWSSSLIHTRKFLVALWKIPRASGQSRAIPADVRRGDTGLSKRKWSYKNVRNAIGKIDNQKMKKITINYTKKYLICSIKLRSKLYHVWQSRNFYSLFLKAMGEGHFSFHRGGVTLWVEKITFFFLSDQQIVDWCRVYTCRFDNQVSNGKLV